MDPRERKSTYDIYKVDYEFIEKCTDKKELKKAIAALEEDNGFPDLVKACKERLGELDPNMRRLLNQKPVTAEERSEIEDDINKFLDSANQDDEALKGNTPDSLFENPKETAANWISSRVTAEDKRLKGNECMKSKDFSDAVKLYTESLKIHEEASCYANRAQAYLKLKDYQNCIRDASKSLEMNEKYVKGFFRRAMGYKALEKFEEAIEDLQSILELEPKSKQANAELLLCW